MITFKLILQFKLLLSYQTRWKWVHSCHPLDIYLLLIYYKKNRTTKQHAYVSDIVYNRLVV